LIPNYFKDKHLEHVFVTLLPREDPATSIIA
jgi:hypothetical protein